MLTNAVQQRRPIEDFPGPKGWLSDMESDQPAAFDLIELSIALPNLLSQSRSLLAQERTLESIGKVESFLEESQKLLHALTEWEIHIPAQWTYTTATNNFDSTSASNVEEAEARPGPMYIYEDVHIASIWSNHRVNQMLCSSVVTDALKWLYPDIYLDDERCYLAENRAQSLVDDICYSVPFHFGNQDWNGNTSSDAGMRAGKELFAEVYNFVC